MKPSPFAPIAIPRYEAAAGDATAKSDPRNAMFALARFEETNEVFLCPLFWPLFERSSLVTHGPTYDIAIRSQNYLVS